MRERVSEWKRQRGRDTYTKHTQSSSSTGWLPSATSSMGPSWRLEPALHPGLLGLHLLPSHMHSREQDQKAEQLAGLGGEGGSPRPLGHRVCPRDGSSDTTPKDFVLGGGAGIHRVPKQFSFKSLTPKSPLIPFHFPCCLWLKRNKCSPTFISVVLFSISHFSHHGGLPALPLPTPINPQSASCLWTYSFWVHLIHEIRINGLSYQLISLCMIFWGPSSLSYRWTSFSHIELSCFVYPFIRGWPGSCIYPLAMMSNSHVNTCLSTCFQFFQFNATLRLVNYLYTMHSLPLRRGMHCNWLQGNFWGPNSSARISSCWLSLLASGVWQFI